VIGYHRDSRQSNLEQFLLISRSACRFDGQRV
jgi:hypothetical protein